MLQPKPQDAFVGLGANVGERLAALQRAVEAMRRWPGTEVVAASSIYETEAHVRPGADPQPDHLNAVVHVRTTLPAHELLRRLHRAEHEAGRDPDALSWSPRPLDLDLLLYGDERVATDELEVPHPRLGERRFVLQPLWDVAPTLVVPGLGKTVAELLDETPDLTRIARTEDSLMCDDPCGL